MTFSADKEMNSSESGSDKSQLLRQKAEAKARSLKAVNPDEFTPEEIKVLLHELQVHQIELEMQNEELRQTQEILEFSRARYIDLYDFAPVGYVTVNREGIIIQANLTAARQLGVSRQQLLKQRLNRFILSEDQDIYYQHCRRPLQKDAVSVCQLRLMRADGGSFYARLETTVFADAEASAPVSQIVICDITAAKQYEQSLKETRNYLEKLIEGAGAPIVVWDTQMRVTAFNFAFESLTGLPAKSVIGKPVELIFAGDPCTGSREKIENAQAGKNWESLEMPVRSADGS